MREDYTSVSVQAVIDCNTESAPVNNSNFLEVDERSRRGIRGT